MGEDGGKRHEGNFTVSIDPSSIPNFGGQPDPQPNGPPALVVPDQDLVKQLLDQMELKYVVDDEGDLAAPWEEFRTYFMFRGEADQQVFAVRTFYDRAVHRSRTSRSCSRRSTTGTAAPCGRRSTPTPTTTARSVSSVRRRLLIGTGRRPGALRLLDGQLGPRVDRVRQVARRDPRPGQGRRRRDAGMIGDADDEGSTSDTGNRPATAAGIPATSRRTRTATRADAQLVLTAVRSRRSADRPRNRGRSRPA